MNIVNLVGTLNINGAREDTKRASVFALITSKRLSVTFLQETHRQLFLSHRSSNSGGVGILFSRDFVPLSSAVEEPVPGRLLKITTVFENVKLVFVNVYAPTAALDRLLLLNEIEKVVAGCNNNEFLFLGGDFNCTENPLLDRNHPEPHLPSKSTLTKLVQARELCDVWRYFHLGQSQFTWTHSRGNQLSLASLDRFYFFRHHINIQ
uniref:exodeoxyribonuclease III n=1 Tax=Takifugu rubripes TaxID=31033 RepID=A0A674NVB8_TAKRU